MTSGILQVMRLLFGVQLHLTIGLSPTAKPEDVPPPPPCTPTWRWQGDNEGKAYHREISLWSDYFETGELLTDISGSMDSEDNECGDGDDDDVAMTANLFERVPSEIVEKLLQKNGGVGTS